MVKNLNKLVKDLILIKKLSKSREDVEFVKNMKKNEFSKLNRRRRGIFHIEMSNSFNTIYLVTLDLNHFVLHPWVLINIENKKYKTNYYEEASSQSRGHWQCCDIFVNFWMRKIRSFNVFT